jgi:hypothetical protein
MKRRKQRGNSLIEFTLIGIPMIFVQLSIFEVARLGWTFHTLSSAVSGTARYAMVHGRNCSIAPNACAIRVRDVARQMKASGVGLVPRETNLSLVSGAGTLTCRLDECLNNTNVWPAGASAEAGQEIEIRATYSMRSMVSMFWPGVGSRKPFGLVRLPASSREVIQF